ncbi:hypothetical protein AMATHDRAFT_8809 [Amanita thiersii Skay4041]|uniref:Uncharacterized protein n=1 Tax=Amanita thiersii Skay4041 TaxID=703135 RepID=A0A2A9N707_9AGAR|nr:hypothetical protein AMATHDRAFT_8809 [Amanita thiersii Skay4041]
MTQNYARATLFFSSDAIGTLDTVKILQTLVNLGTITQMVANKGLEDKTNNWIPRLKKDIDAITEKSAYDELKKFDSGHTSWTNDDPDYNYIIDKLKNI